MDYNAYKNPDKSDLVRNLKNAVESYSEIIELRRPLDTMKQIQEETKEYKELIKNMKLLPFYKHVKVYFDQYYNNVNELYYKMSLMGSNIERGYGNEKSDIPGKTLHEEYDIVREAANLLSHKKREFKNLYTYLTTNGANDLKLFEQRNVKNKTLYIQALNSCIEGDPQKQLQKVNDKEYAFRHKTFRPSPLYLTKVHLESHLLNVIENQSLDEIALTYFTKDELNEIQNGTNVIDSNINTINYNRVEEYIKKIATGEINLPGIAPNKEDQPQ